MTDDRRIKAVAEALFTAYNAELPSLLLDESYLNFDKQSLAECDSFVGGAYLRYAKVVLAASDALAVSDANYVSILVDTIKLAIEMLINAGCLEHASALESIIDKLPPDIMTAK